MKTFPKIAVVLLSVLMMMSFASMTMSAVAADPTPDPSKTYDLLYLTNGSGVDGATMPAKVKNLKIGDVVALDTSAAPTRTYNGTEYTFLGWSLTGGNHNASNIVTSVTIGQSNLIMDTYGRYVVYAAWSVKATYSEPTVSSQPTVSSEPIVSSDPTVSSEPSQQYDLLYLTNGNGVDHSTMPAKAENLSLGSEVTLDTASIPVRVDGGTEYEFLGWSLTGGRNNSDDIVTTVTIGQSGLVMDTYGRYVVYASWQEKTTSSEPAVSSEPIVSSEPAVSSEPPASSEFTYSRSYRSIPVLSSEPTISSEPEISVESISSSEPVSSAESSVLSTVSIAQSSASTGSTVSISDGEVPLNVPSMDTGSAADFAPTVAVACAVGILMFVIFGRKENTAE